MEAAVAHLDGLALPQAEVLHRGCEHRGLAGAGSAGVSSLGLELLVSPQLLLVIALPQETCSGCAQAHPCCQNSIKLTRATLKSKASPRSAKLRPTKAWRPVVESTRRSTKLRELSAAGSTACGRCPGGTGQTAKVSPLQARLRLWPDQSQALEILSAHVSEC